MNDDNSNNKQNQQEPVPIEEAPEANDEVVYNNQNKSVYETVTEDTHYNQVPEELPHEEVFPEKEASHQSSQNIPETIPSDIHNDGNVPPPMFEESKTRYIFIGLGAVVFIIVFVLILKLILGLGSQKNAKVNLTYWGLWEDKKVIDPLIADYKRTHPNVVINYQKMDPQDYRAKLLARSKEGKGPDIFRYHNTWLPTITEVVAPLPKTIFTDKDYESTFYPVVQTDLKIGDNYFGIPLEIDGLVLVYNDELLKKAGIEVVPKTWEEMIDAVSKLTVKNSDGKIITSGLAIGTASNVDHYSDIFGWMLLQNGGTLKSISSPEGSGALEQFRKFAEAPNNIWDESMPNSVNAFIQRNAAMIIVPSWEILTIKHGDPDIPLKVSTLPILTGGNLLSISNYWVEGVSRYSKNQLEAWKFLQFLIQKENLTKLYAESSKERLFGEPYSRVDLASTLQSDPYLGPLIQQAPYMQSLPLISRTQDNGLNDEIIKYIEDGINQTIKGVSYGEALSTVQKGIEQVFTKYSIN